MKPASLDSVAKLLNIPPVWLDKLITFESGWNPTSTNKYTGARGLIQFMPKTAQALGYKDANDLIVKNPSIDSQLKGPVYAYLKAMMPYPTPQSLYMAVFFPAARNWSNITTFPAYVQKVNPGIITVSDYIRKVDFKFHKNIILVGILSALGMGIYLLTKTKGVSLI